MAGSDSRMALDPEQGLNKYGCAPRPDPQLAAFGSSTASVISTRGFAAANRLRSRFLLAARTEPLAVTCARELHRICIALMRLCGLTEYSSLEIRLAESGTALHSIAALRACEGESLPVLAVIVEATETGSGVVPALSAGGAVEVVTVSVRLADGTPRSPTAVNAEIESLVHAAAAQGRRVLLVGSDQSKTGLIAPSTACLIALQRELPNKVDILIDACQFRIAKPTLRAYLAHGFMVALTGSKFVTGPAFSGALFIPTLNTQLSAKSGSNTSTTRTDDLAKIGLILRWEAALAELRAFSALPPTDVARFLQTFADAMQQRLESDPLFEPLPGLPLDRRPLIEANSWDQIPTIFPFLLYHPDRGAGRVPLTREETDQVYRALQINLSGHGASSNAIAALRGQLGQPVACGSRGGVPVSALRLCASARLVVEALSNGEESTSAVIQRANAVLDKVALLGGRLN